MKVILITQVVLLGVIVCSHNQPEWKKSRQAEKDITEWVLNRTTTSYQPDNLEDGVVRLDLSLYRILDIDDNQGTIRLKLLLSMYYHLDGMNWTQEFQDMPSQELSLPSGTLWTPKFLFLGAINVKTFDFSQTINTDGFANALFSMYIVKNSCFFNMRRFPFDTQVSTLQTSVRGRGVLKIIDDII